MDDLDVFFKTAGAILDVRSPGEYVQGHIPGALNLPLFSNEERAAVGTLYKQSGKEAAVELGLRYVGPKLADFVLFAKKQQQVRVHCWRGGMRSSSMAWVLETAGIPTVTLKGGYKAYRRSVLQVLEQPKKFLVIGGLTGSGKSEILHSLKELGEQVLDLETLACHRGSSYGHLGMAPQPTYEQFENEIAEILKQMDGPIWVEDESRMVGRCKIPDPLFQQMQRGPLLIVDCPIEERLERLYNDYGQKDPAALIAATRGLTRRLGGERAEKAVRLIEQGCIKEAIAVTLSYYDTAYRYSLSRKGKAFHTITEQGLSPKQWAQELMRFKNA